MPPLVFFNDTATTEIYTLSLHDALPIWPDSPSCMAVVHMPSATPACGKRVIPRYLQICGLQPLALALTKAPKRSEEHTSELQSRQYLVCRLLLEKKQGISARQA